jgi:hypothetical protein
VIVSFVALILTLLFRPTGSSCPRPNNHATLRHRLLDRLRGSSSRSSSWPPRAP